MDNNCKRDPPQSEGVYRNRGELREANRMGKAAMLEELLGLKVVVDFAGEYVALGTLKRLDEHFLELKNADLHDLRDTDSTREIYVAESVRTGIKRNRKSVVISRAQVVAVAKLDDVVEE